MTQLPLQPLVDPNDILAELRRLIGLPIQVAPSFIDPEAPLPRQAEAGMLETARIAAYQRPVARASLATPKWQGEAALRFTLASGGYQYPLAALQQGLWRADPGEFLFSLSGAAG